MEAATDVSVLGAFTGNLTDTAGVHAHMLHIFQQIHTRYGVRYTESLYQRAIVRRAYLDMLPTMTERELFVDHGEGSLLVGRVDLEVAGTCLYEFKIGSPNIARDTEQVNKYLCAYDMNQERILVACLVYFTHSGLVVHEIRNITESSITGKKRKVDSAM